MCGMTTGRRCRFAWDYGKAQIPGNVENCYGTMDRQRTLEQAVAVARWAHTASDAEKIALQQSSGFAVTSEYFIDLIDQYAIMDVNPYEIFGPELLHTWSLGY